MAKIISCFETYFLQGLAIDSKKTLHFSALANYGPTIQNWKLLTIKDIFGTRYEKITGLFFW